MTTSRSLSLLRNFRGEAHLCTSIPNLSTGFERALVPLITGRKGSTTGESTVMVKRRGFTVARQLNMPAARWSNAGVGKIFPALISEATA